MVAPIPMTLGILTVGHSTHPIEEFLELLRAAGATCLVDIRTLAGSRHNPQFNQDVLPAALAPHGIAYEAMASLGGRRSRQRNVAPEVNGFWDNRSFHNYADYALQPAFRDGLAELRAKGQRERCAVMCSEAVWWRCHRRIIADWLLAAGEDVRHIMEGRIEAAHLTAGAQIGADGQISYPGPSGA